MATEAEKLLEEARKRSAMTPAQQMLAEARAAQGSRMPVQEGESRAALGAGEAGLAMASGLVGMEAAGLAGMAQSVATPETRMGRGMALGDLTLPVDLPEVADIIRRVQSAFTYQPRTPEGQQALQAIGEAMQTATRGVESTVAAGAGVPRSGGRYIGSPIPTSEDMQAAQERGQAVFERGPGDVVMDATGSPAAATFSELGIDIAGLGSAAKPLMGARKVDVRPPYRIPDVPRTKLDMIEQDIIRSLESDAAIERVTPFRLPRTRRKDQLNALYEARLTAKQIGDNARVADIAGSETKSMTRAQSALSREGELLRHDIIKRNNEMRGRMGGFIDEKLFKERSYDETINAIDTRMKKDSAPLYQVAYEQDVPLTPPLVNILREPSVQQAIPKAIELLKIETRIPKDMRAAALQMFGVKRKKKVDGKTQEVIVPLTPNMKAGGEIVIIPDNVNMMGLDYLKRGIDERTSSLVAVNPKSQEAGALSVASGNLRENLVNVNKAYGEALDAWSTGVRAKEAAELGKTARSRIAKGEESIESVIAEFEGLSNYEKQLYMIGRAEDMRAHINLRPDTTEGVTPDSVLNAFAGSPAERQLLEAVFESPDDFRQFEQFMNVENIYSATTKAVNITDDLEKAIRGAFDQGSIPQVLARESTNALFAASGNRYALLNLIQNYATNPVRTAKRHKLAPAQARAYIGESAIRVIDQIIPVLEAKQNLPGPVTRMIAGVKDVATRRPEQVAKWLADEKNRRALYMLGVITMAVEDARNEEIDNG